MISKKSEKSGAPRSFCRALTVARELLGGVLELVFPQICLVCGGASKEPLCEGCAGGFLRITGPVCEKCGKPSERPLPDCRECRGKDLHFTLARSGGAYTGSLKSAIHSLKYKNGKRLAAYLGHLLDNMAIRLIENVDAVAHVPLSKRKEAERGYNQSGLLAKELARRHNKPLYTKLAKVKNIPEQHRLGFAGREDNVKGAFRAFGKVPERVLLIDDVYTTGSTASECASALKERGATVVYVLTVARTPLDSPGSDRPRAVVDSCKCR